jgi:hypothetical protein
LTIIYGSLAHSLWNNEHVLIKGLTGLLLLLASITTLLADDVAPAPKLLLSAQRLRRLKRDRERKTPRWVSFENRVNNVPDSPERGFELALYYAITGDEGKGREAVAWALAHKSARLSALVIDWCGPLVSAEDKNKLLQIAYMGNGNPLLFAIRRDGWFLKLASSADVPAAPDLAPLMDRLTRGEYENGSELYALCELIYTARANTHTDLREADPSFFAKLPELVLLSAKPSELNKPDWQMHAAALALVAIDPNLPASQFLQGWALEDAQTLRDGPGVAYELLWADPYLPGVGYQNMDTWSYDEHGRLFARSDWEPNSCWIEISTLGVDEQNCPPNWQSQNVTFGHLSLIPMTERCVDIPHVMNRNETVLVWKLKPGESMTHGKGKDAHTSAADAAGIWRPGAAIEGKVCLSGH